MEPGRETAQPPDGLVVEREGDMARLVGGVEAGGTKFVCAVGTGPDDVRAEARFPTTTPAETLGHVVAFFSEQAARAPLAALGVASFGPIDLDPRSTTFGSAPTAAGRSWGTARWSRRRCA